MSRRSAGGYRILTTLLFVLAAGAPSSGSAAPIAFVYRYAPGDSVVQTTRQSQSFVSEARPDLSGGATTQARSEAKVVDVDAAGSAILDEVAIGEGDAADPDAEPRRDHRRFRTTRLGEIVWVDIVSGEPSALRGGALFVNRPVRPGDTWRTRMKGSGGGPAYAIDLDVRFDSTSGEGWERTALFKLSGAMDAKAVTSMLGEAGVAQGLRGKACQVSGAIVFRILAGLEATSRLDLECDLELLGDAGPPTPASLHISYETTNEGPIRTKFEAP
ncbi:MAG: hypothetical protein HY049_07940 [Acidobacteria bacterium]|nr:hypothetical protein [Acidobacteriota bacterium]